MTAELKKRLEEASCSVLLIGDIHLRDSPPRNASETYTDDILDILKYTAKMQHELGISAVVWAGDVFDHKTPSKTSHRLVLRAIEAVKRYKELWIVTGNHDISHDRLESVAEQQPLGVLFEAGARELNGWHPELPVFGIPWQQDWLKPGTVNSSFELRHQGRIFAPSRPGLVVTHAPISPHESEMYDVLDNHEIAEAMKNTGSLYYGHIHEDHGIYEVDGVTFCNVGAVSRGSLTESNLKRKIKAALWTPEHGFLEVELPHRPAEEVLRIESGTQAKEARISLESFLEDVGRTRLDVSSTAVVIQHIRALNEERVPPPVKSVAISLLEEQDG